MMREIIKHDGTVMSLSGIGDTLRAAAVRCFEAGLLLGVNENSAAIEFKDGAEVLITVDEQPGDQAADLLLQLIQQNLARIEMDQDLNFAEFCFDGIRYPCTDGDWNDVVGRIGGVDRIKAAIETLTTTHQGQTDQVQGRGEVTEYRPEDHPNIEDQAQAPAEDQASPEKSKTNRTGDGRK